MVRSLTRGRLPKPLALVVSAVLALFWVAVAPVGPANAAVVGGFEIDGNKSLDGQGLDWNGVAAQVVADPIGNTDATVYSTGSKESDPAGWTFNTTAGASGKADIGNSYVHDDYVDGDFWFFYAFDRDTDNGTVSYFLELNQLTSTTNANGVVVPRRSVGDLRFTLTQQGSQAFGVFALERWGGSGWTTTGVTLPASAWKAAVSADQRFVEFAFNLSVILESVLGEIECGDVAFSQLFLRSMPAGPNANAELKDFAAGRVDIDACASMTIRKFTSDGQTPLAGATFSVVPNPTGGESLVVTDGGAGDGDGEANGVVTLDEINAGTYTVTEIAPPDGWLRDGADARTKTVEPGDDVSFSFTNSLGQVSFTKQYEGRAPAEGARFDLVRQQRWVYTGGTPSLEGISPLPTAVSVQDNGTNDADDALGAVTVQGLRSGYWCVTETEAPTGWAPAAGEQCFTVGPEAGQAAGVFDDGTPEPTFVNTLRPIALQVLKTGSIPGVDGTFPLPGVTFTLYSDDGDGVWEPGVDGMLPDGAQTTGADGVLTWSGLDWQQRYWLSESKLAGYAIGLNPNPKLVELSAPSTDDVVVTVDVDNPREEFSVELVKVDGTDGSALTGGGFQLWRETNGRPGLQRDGDDPDLNVNGTVALVDGSLRFDAATHHIPWGFDYYLFEATAPAGYGLMSPNPVTITEGRAASVAGTTVTVQAEDPRQAVGLQLLKKDDFGGPVAGAVFQLYLDDGDGAFEPCVPEATSCAGKDSAVGGQVTSAVDGTLTWPSGLTWGLPYWAYEVSAPSGYLPMTPNPAGPVTIPRSAAGAVHDATALLDLVDPRVRGGFSIVKTMLDLPDGERPAFTVDVTCGPDGRYLDDTLTLQWPTWTAVVSGVPVGEKCTVTEPVVPQGWDLVRIDNATVTVVEAPAEQRDVEVVNQRQHDRFDFAKVVTGTQVPGESASFTVQVDCLSADPGADDYDQNVYLATPGLTGSTQPIPTGLECEFTETQWDDTRYAPVGIVPSSATVGDGAVGTITVTNERRQATLEVTKRVLRPVAGEDDSFVIDVVCSNGYSTSFDLADGESGWIDPQPVGVTCVVTEDEDLATFDPVRYREVSAQEQTGTVRLGQDAETVTVVNQRLYGGLELQKNPEGLLPGENASFEVYLDCTGDAYDRSYTLDTRRSFDEAVYDLPAGIRCSLTEPVVPQGWTLEGVRHPGGGDSVLVTEGLRADFAQITVTNQRERTRLDVRKVDGDGRPLAGARFDLWQSTDDVLGDAGDVVVGSCTTSSAGTCGVGGIDWGFSYFWEEVRAPQGYNLPTQTVLGPVAVTAGNVSGALAVTQFVDLMTELTTTPFVGGSPVEDLATDLARVDENDTVSDRAELAGLSHPATGSVTFSLYGPFRDTTLNGMSFEPVSCEGEPVFVSPGNAISWNAAAGRYEAFSAELAVGGASPLEPGLYQWVADFEATDGKNLGATGECPDPTEQVVVRAGDLPGIDKSADPQSGSVVQPGSVITYSVAVSNSGDMPIPAQEAVVVDTLDSHLEFVAMVGGGAPQPTVTAGADGTTVLTWNVGELPAGSAVRLDYLVHVGDDAPQGITVDNTACFFAECVGTTHGVPEGDLTIVKTVDPTSGTGVVVGDTLTYTLTVTATGALDQREVLVVDNLPGTDENHRGSLGASYVVGSARCLGAGVCEVGEPGGDGAVSWYLGDLPAGSSRQVTFQVTVDPVAVAGEGTVNAGDVLNSAWAGSYDTDWTPSNVVRNPVSVVLGVKIAPPVPKPAVAVLGTKLPRTGAGIGVALWAAGALLVLGGGLRAAAEAGSRRRA